MNSLERTLTAIKHKSTDKVPIDLHNFQMCAEISGLEFDQFFKSGDKMAQCQIELWEEFGHDVIMMENGTAALAEALGCEVVYRRNETPAVRNSFLKKLDDVEKLSPIKINDCSILKENLIATSKVCRKLGDKAFIIGRGDQGPFSLASLLLGMDDFLVELALRDNLDQIHKLLQYCTDFIIAYALEQLKCGALCTSIGDSTAGPDVVSPAIYEEFAFPYEKRIVEEVHRAGGMIALHICGNATQIIDKMVDTGADILEIDQKTDLLKARELTKGKVTLLGQISPLTLRIESLEEIGAQVKSTLDCVGNEGGFILGPGCALASDTPYENIKEIFRIRDQYQFLKYNGGHL